MPCVGGATDDMTHEDDTKTLIGPASILAFTNTDHYEPSLAGAYWFGCDEPQMRDANTTQGHYRTLPIAVVKSSQVGLRWALGMHHGEKEVLMKSLERRHCTLYVDPQQHYFFCVCGEGEKRAAEEVVAHERKCKVFISYSHADSKYLDEGSKTSLLSYLKTLEKEGVELWVDRGIRPGDYWDKTIRENIESADVALVLVSQAFLNSDYCNTVEMSAFINKQKERGLRILPVILSPCDWKSHAWLSKIQCLPRDGKTIESHYTGNKRKEIYLEILEELRHWSNNPSTR